MPIPMINASTGRQVSDGRQSTYTGLGNIYAYGSAMPYGPYSQLPRAGAAGTPGSSSGSSSSTASSGKTPEAKDFLNQVLGGQQLPYSPDRINQLYSQASDQNAAAETALQGQIASRAAAGGATSTDPSLQGAQLGAMAKRQTANAMANRDINETATGANFQAKMQAAAMLEESRRQSEALQAGVQRTAMGYMPWNSGGGGGGSSGGNNFTGTPGMLEYQNANLGRFRAPTTSTHRTAADWRENARINNLSQDDFDREFEDFMLGTGNYA